MPIELAQLSIAIPLIAFLLYIISTEELFLRAHKKWINFLCDFPYEAYEKRKDPLGLTFLVAFFLSELLPNVTMFVAFHDASPSLIGLMILSSVLTIVLGYLILRIHTLTASLEKAHLGRFYALGLGLILLSSVNGIVLINLSKGTDVENLILGLSIGLFVVALSTFFILINPRLKDWARLVKVVDEDGLSSLKRPVPFILALSEWVVIFLSVISWLLLSLGNYFLIK